MSVYSVVFFVCFRGQVDVIWGDMRYSSAIDPVEYFECGQVGGFG
jgi:hypothetical protein